MSFAREKQRVKEARPMMLSLPASSVQVARSPGPWTGFLLCLSTAGRAHG
jgi:hypothetical protein